MNRVLRTYTRYLEAQKRGRNYEQYVAGIWSRWLAQFFQKGR